MTQETYAHAPIVEAVLDIRTRLPFNTLPKSFQELHNAIEDTYPKLRHPFRVEFKLQKDADGEPVTETAHSPNGFVFVSSDELQLFQARPDGFSHNRLAPYVDWASFKSEARRLWTNYREFAQPEVIEMLGLNYINRIHIPLGVEINDYLRTYIEIPKELPQTLQAHNLFVQMSDPASDGNVAISISLGPMSEMGKVPVTLNVQAFKNLNTPVANISDEVIWTTFENLRVLKNLAFESSITEKVRTDFR